MRGCTQDEIDTMESSDQARIILAQKDWLLSNRITVLWVVPHLIARRLRVSTSFKISPAQTRRTTRIRIPYACTVATKYSDSW